MLLLLECSKIRQRLASRWLASWLAGASVRRADTDTEWPAGSAVQHALPCPGSCSSSNSRPVCSLHHAYMRACMRARCAHAPTHRRSASPSTEPTCARYCLTNSMPVACFFQNLSTPSTLVVMMKSLLVT